VAVGKTTVGRLLAARLRYRFVDTGNMYRAVAWKALRNGVDSDDAPSLTILAERIHLELLPGNGNEPELLVDGQPVSTELRSPQVEQTVSSVSSILGVRRALIKHQRNLARKGRIVMVGRDIGTDVLPQAEIKVFLKASAQERARRRHREIHASAPRDGSSFNSALNTTLTNLVQRDRMDSRRAVSPLRPAADAAMIDTEGLAPNEVVERICRLMNPA
jgi:cytidylate kinase